MLTLLVVIWISFDILSGGYILKPENIANLFRQVTVVAILAVGMTLVIVSGNIDLSVGSALGMFGALTAMLVTNIGVNSVLSVLLVLGAGFGVGCAHGALIHYAGIPAFVMTLGGLIAYRGITQIIARQTIPVRVEWIKAIAQKSIPDTLSLSIILITAAIMIYALYNTRNKRIRAGMDAGPAWIGIFKLVVLLAGIAAISVILLNGEGFPVMVVLLMAVSVLFSFITKYTPFGHYIYAIGGNKQAALYSGIPIAKNRVLVFGIMGLLSATAGIISISELSSAAPDIGDLKELEAIAACVIGGASLMGGSGNIGMSILGALIMASIKNGMSMMGVAAQLQKVILGSLLVIAVGLDQITHKNK